MHSVESTTHDTVEEHSGKFASAIIFLCANLPGLNGQNRCMPSKMAKGLHVTATIYYVIVDAAHLLYGHTT
jgi:hypothetical protein